MGKLEEENFERAETESLEDSFDAVEEEDFGFDPSDADSFDLDIQDFRDQPGVEYPAMLLSRVVWRDCLLVLTSQKKQSYRMISVWFEGENGEGYEAIGEIQLTSDILLVLRHLRIGVTIYWDQDNMEVLNLEDPEVIERFI